MYIYVGVFVGVDLVFFVLVFGCWGWCLVVCWVLGLSFRVLWVVGFWRLWSFGWFFCG